MNNDVTETTTDSSSKQGSIMHRPKLYTGISTLIVIVTAALVVGAKFSHDAQFTLLCLRFRLSTSANRCRKSYTGGFNSLDSSRPWTK